MVKVNTKTNNGYVAGTPTTTFEGGSAVIPADKELLRRLVFSCFLWEDNFYVDGKRVADQITETAQKVAKSDPQYVLDVVVEARKVHNLRHVPLWLMVALAKVGKLNAETVAATISRPDEMGELLAQYSKANGRTGTKTLGKLSKAIQKGLAQAFGKFDEYQLAKWNRDSDIKLKDILFLTHAKPKDEAQAAMWKRLIEDKMALPDTWEVGLSAGNGKKETFEALLREGKLGYMALLMNLRNMREAGVDTGLVFQELQRGAGRSKILPFQFITAARHNPQWEPQIEQAMLNSLAGMTKLPGKTILLVDVSGSMAGKISEKSELSRRDAAAAIAMLLREICDDVLVYTFADDCNILPARRGFGLIEAINGVRSGGTRTAKALAYIDAQKHNADRILVFTDEQAHDNVGTAPAKKGYIMNVASYDRGVGYGKNWTHVNGFSEAVVKYIQEMESGD